MLLSIFFFFISFFVFFDFLLFLWLVPFILFFLFLFYGGFRDGVFLGDYFSVLLVFVTFWVFFLSIISLSFSFYSFYLMFFIIFLLFLSFFFMNYLVFYFSFELVFIIIFGFLLGWGNTIERLQASFYMFFYTMFFSLPFLIFILFYFFRFSVVFLRFSFFYHFLNYLWVFVFFVFVVKLPLYGFHLWLPKAHVEAPVSGSMILAGVLLKLGGYGVFRFFPLLNMLSFSRSFFFSYFFYLSLYGGVLVSFLCVRQMDLKILIAYSSVVHIRVGFIGLIRFSLYGLYGSLLMIVSHGFVSPLMFFLMTYVYNFKYSRSIMVIKGLIMVLPLFCFFWFLRCSLNLGLPPFMSFYSELIVFSSLLFLSFFDWFFIILTCFFTGVYCIYCYVVISHGDRVYNFFFFLDFKTFLISLLHFFFIFSYPLVFFLF